VLLFLVLLRLLELDDALDDDLSFDLFLLVILLSSSSALDALERTLTVTLVSMDVDRLVATVERDLPLLELRDDLRREFFDFVFVFVLSPWHFLLLRLDSLLLLFFRRRPLP